MLIKFKGNVLVGGGGKLGTILSQVVLRPCLVFHKHSKFVYFLQFLQLVFHCLLCSSQLLCEQYLSQRYQSIVFQEEGTR